VESVLIAAASEKSAALIEDLLRSRYRDILTTVALDGSRARRQLLERGYDLMIVSAPLSDETGMELAAQTASSNEMGVLLLVKAAAADEISARVEEYGVFVVEKPLHRPFFFRALRLLETAGRRLKGLETEKEKLQQKIEEIRLVDRAKCALIQYLNMTEPQAHRYIEKQAMDLRTSRREVALGVLKTYES